MLTYLRLKLNKLILQTYLEGQHVFSVCIICKYSKFLNVFFQYYMVLL